MTKKVVTKTVTIRETKHPRKKHSPTKETKPQIDKILIENFVGIQKVMTDLTIKVDSLTNKLSSLLSLFESSAKTIVEKEYSKEISENQKILEQLNNLSEQNKIIARGLTIFNEKKEVPKIEYPKLEIQTNNQEPKLMEDKKINNLPR